MMYADRYRTNRLHPGSLTLSLAIVGGLVAAAMLSKTVVAVIEREKTIELVNVPPAPPPPPPVQRVTPKVEPRPAPRVDQPTVIIPRPPEPTAWVRPDPGPPPPLPGSGTAEGTGTAVLDPPKPPPVLTRADIDPRYAGDFQPTYPAEERRAGNEGVVTLRVLIGVDGRVREVERVASPSDAFWRVTEQRARTRWRFKPATRDGIPQESWRTMTVRFRLEA